MKLISKWQIFTLYRKTRHALLHTYKIIINAQVSQRISGQTFNRYYYIVETETLNDIILFAFSSTILLRFSISRLIDIHKRHDDESTRSLKHCCTPNTAQSTRLNIVIHWYYIISIKLNNKYLLYVKIELPPYYVIKL